MYRDENCLRTKYFGESVDLHFIDQNDPDSCHKRTSNAVVKCTAHLPFIPDYAVWVLLVVVDRTVSLVIYISAILSLFYIFFHWYSYHLSNFLFLYQISGKHNISTINKIKFCISSVGNSFVFL